MGHILATVKQVLLQYAGDRRKLKLRIQALYLTLNRAQIKRLITCGLSTLYGSSGRCLT